MAAQRYDLILEFWFGNSKADPMANAPQWFVKDPSFDLKIKNSFEKDIRAGTDGRYEGWKKEARSSLALIILFDQFSRNVYRDTPGAFAQDVLAMDALTEGLDNGLDQKLSPVQKWFYYMPLMHSEDLDCQKQSLSLFKKLSEEAPDSLKKPMENAYSYAVKHADIVKRFGRYPHRNDILGRKSTPAEIEFLKGPGSSF